MDGGRVLRALLAIRLPRLQATRIAVYVSAGMAVLFGLVGVSILHNPMLLLVGLFVIWAGQQELQHLEMREHEREEHAAADRESFGESGEGGWHGIPRAAVTVYLWDARKHAWVPQGVVGPNPGSNPRG
jgi:hypothetical protein